MPASAARSSSAMISAKVVIAGVVYNAAEYYDANADEICEDADAHMIACGIDSERFGETIWPAGEIRASIVQAMREFVHASKLNDAA